MKNQNIQQQVLSKKAVLELTAKTLKQEFIGLDLIIDELLSVLAPWYLFPDGQLRPTVVNLWGMTGTGKTALVHRMVELIGFAKSYVHLDMGEFGQYSQNWLKSMLHSDLAHLNGEQSVICLDEFQFARTLNQTGGEMDKDKLRIIWELLDSGKFYYNASPSQFYIKKGFQALELIRQCIEEGVVVENGKVTENKTVFEDVFKGFGFGYYDGKEKKKAGYFNSKSFVNGLYELVEDRYSSRYVLAEKLKFMSLDEIGNFLMEAIFREGSLKEMNLSGSLIVVIGNLDEAYYMSSNINPDISADEFYKSTLKLSISDIKTALQRRFRNEQIARLGNNHLIYPAFSASNYRKFIRMQLRKVNEFVQQKFGFTFEFDQSLEEVIYLEGVFPTQGVRPILTTVKNLVESYMSRVICDLASRGLQAHKIRWIAHEETYTMICYGAGGEKLRTFLYPVHLKLHRLRKSKNDEVQAHTAVHEAGHAVLAALSLRILPELVVTQTADSQSEGFCQVNYPENLSTRELIFKRIIIGLGGLVAERLVFGPENTSTGVRTDIRQVTELANDAIKKLAMGDDPIRVAVESVENEDAFFEQKRFSKMAFELIKKGEAEAERLLVRNKKLLLEMADYLSHHSRLEREQIGEMVVSYGKESWIQTQGFIEAEGYFNFKQSIRSQLKELGEE